MAGMTDAERDAFLNASRYGILSHLSATGAPISVPVWFGWDGRAVSMFTHVSTPKVRALKRDQRVSLLVTNFPQERESWVRFEGEVTIAPGGLEVAQALVDRYWPEGDTRRPQVNDWAKSPDEWLMLALVPQTIRTYRE